MSLLTKNTKDIFQSEGNDIVGRIMATFLNPDTLKENLGQTLQILRNFLQCELIEVWVADIDEDLIKLINYEFDHSNKAVVNFVDKTLAKNCGSVYTKSQSWYSDKRKWADLSLEDAPLMRRIIAVDAGLQTLIGLPIRKFNETLAYVNIFYSKKIVASNEMDKLLNVSLSQIALHIEQVRLSSLVDKYFKNTKELLCITNFDYKIQLATNAFVDLVGIKGDEVYLKKFHELGKSNIPFDENFIGEHITRNESNSTNEITYINGAQNTVIVWSSSVVLDEKIIIFSGKDVTNKKIIVEELKAKNAALGKTTDDLKRILNNINELVFKLDINGNFIEVSDNIKNILGYAQIEVVGSSFLAYTHVDEAEDLHRRIILNIDNGVVVKNLKHRVKAKDGSWKWLSTSGEVIFNEENKPRYIIGLSTDVTAAYHATINLEQEQEKYKALFAHHPLPLILYDLETYNIIQVNEAACLQYGFADTDFHKINFKQLSDITKNLKTAQEYVKNRKETNQKKYITRVAYHKTKNKGSFIAEIKCHQIIYEQRLAELALIADITDQVNAQEELKQSELRYKTFIKNSKDSVYRYETKLPIPINLPTTVLKKRIVDDFYLAESNGIMSVRYQYPDLDKVIGMSLRELYKLQQLDFENGADLFIKNNFEITDFEARSIASDGKPIVLLTNIKGIVEDGKLIRIWGSSKDITASKMAEEELVKSELRYKMFIENSNESIYRFEAEKPIDLSLPKDEITEAILNKTFLAEHNHIFKKRLGFSDDELIVNKTYGEIYLARRANIKKYINQFIESNYELVDFRIQSKDTNGKPIFLVNNIKGFIENGHLVRVWGSTYDETVHVDETNKNKYLVNIIDNLSDAIYTCNNDLEIITWNKGAEMIYGIRKEDAIGRKISTFFEPTYEIGSREKLIKEVHDNGIWIGEVVFKRKHDGHLLTLLSTVSLVKNENGKRDDFVIISKNITERKQAELALRESEIRFRNIGDQAPIMLWQSDETGHSTYYSSAVLNYTGLGLQQQLNTKWETLIHPNDLQKAKRLTNEAISKRRPFELEYRLKNKHNEYRWLLDKATPIFLANGEFKGYIGLCIDIHERELALVKIKESEERFRNMADKAPVMIWLTNEKGESTYYSQGWLDFVGNTLEQELANEWATRIWDIDKEVTVAKYKNAIKHREPFEIEYRLIDKDGLPKWVIDKGTPRYLSNGEFVGYIGVSTEIENLKQAQQKLKIANDKFILLNEATNEAIWDADLENDIGFWGLGYKKLFGHERESIDYDFWISKVHPDDREKVNDVFQRLDPKKLAINNILSCEYRFQKADGAYAIVYDVAYIILNEEGKPVRMIGSKRDITQQKELESKLIQVEIEKQIGINKAMIEGQEKEKIELSQELHDNINQLISTSKLYMEVAKRGATNTEMIDRAIETLSVAVQEIRKLSKSLNPATVNQLQFVDAVEQLIFDIEETEKLEIDFDHSEFDYNITLPQLNLYLYRIVQEQLNNIMKYAETDKATIVLKNNEHYLYLRIADNGVGFDTSLHRKGIGISNIINRVTLFKGIIDIDSAPGKGCAIEINIPLDIEYF
jgi:PAS domain S-box-containing protein